MSPTFWGTSLPSLKSQQIDGAFLSTFHSTAELSWNLYLVIFFRNFFLTLKEAYLPGKRKEKGRNSLWFFLMTTNQKHSHLLESRRFCTCFQWLPWASQGLALGDIILYDISFTIWELCAIQNRLALLSCLLWGYSQVQKNRGPEKGGINRDNACQGQSHTQPIPSCVTCSILISQTPKRR